LEQSKDMLNEVEEHYTVDGLKLVSESGVLKNMSAYFLGQKDKSDVLNVFRYTGFNSDDTKEESDKMTVTEVSIWMKMIADVLMMTIQQSQLLVK
jgi:hypothetical protein